jgi:hypothetical protein
VPPYVLMGEDEAKRLGDRVDVLLLSEGTGPQGRQRTALATPRGSASAAGAAAAVDDAPPSAGSDSELR